MDIRAKRQEEAVRSYLEHVDGRTIINACPRFGKIKVAIDIMKQRGYYSPIIVAPRRDIEEGWIADFQKFDFGCLYQFHTFASIKNMEKGPGDVYLVDEPHELSMNQQKDLAQVVEGKPTLGLTGTMTKKTRAELYHSLELDVCYEYTIDQGVREGILTDYELIIHRIPLDDLKKVFVNKKGKAYTEKKWFGVNMFIRDKAKQKWFHDIKLIQLLQNSRAKLVKTRELIEAFKEDRILVFCGTTEIADNLGISVYHSKAKEEQIFRDFCSGQGVDHLATIKMMQAGITVSPIKRGIMNYLSGSPEDSAQKICRFLGFEYDNPDKKAEIHIISSTEPFEIQRLEKGLSFFDKEKITIKV